jgi:hypothetical protein
MNFITYIYQCYDYVVTYIIVYFLLLMALDVVCVSYSLYWVQNGQLRFHIQR